MTSYVTPKKNTEYIFYVGLTSQANTKIFQANPTLAAGDAQVSTDGGALGNLATIPAVTPGSSKMVKVTLSAGEMNGDNVTVVFSDAAGAEWCDLVVNIQTTARQIDDLAFPTTSGRSIDVSATGEVEANVTQIDAAATSGNNATLNLKQLNIVNNAGSALVASSTGSDGHGIEASGNGGGEGIKATGGATGSGIEAVGGATSGHGVSGVATASNSDGMRLSGVGAGSGLQTIGGATGHGIQAIGGQTSGNGIRARVNVVGASNDNGMSIEGSGSGNGLYVVGGATGHGFQATGGATSGNAINAAATAGNGHGVNIAGQGSGHGINVTGGATGNGIDANGGATSGDGINAAAPTLGDGMQLTGAGVGGLDLDAAINEFTAAGLAQFFLTDSGETYASSVAGSVVQEITVNSGGAGITAQDVRDAMKLAPTAGAAAVGSVDVKLDDILDDTGTSGVVISTTTQNSIADALLKRDWTAITGEAARSALNALRAIRNRVRINAGTMSIFEEDDASVAWSAPVTTDAAALPIIEIDPT